jgi:hypothetical protein
MGIDYAAKEREFLLSLAEDTGRDLAGWMEAIAQSGLEDRNAIIDWLRTQGFLFAKASWMERIYHNGGRPIYLDPAEIGQPSEPEAESGTPPQPTVPPVTPAALPSQTQTSRPPATLAPETAVAAAPVTAHAAPPALDDLLAEAKAYRPLAQLVLREIEKVVGNVRFEAAAGYVSLQGPEEFGILTIAPRELRLALACGTRAAPAPFVKARFPKSHPNMPARMTHMIVLTDARQVTPELMAAIRTIAS